VCSLRGSRTRPDGRLRPALDDWKVALAQSKSPITGAFVEPTIVAWYGVVVVAFLGIRRRAACVLVGMAAVTCHTPDHPPELSTSGSSEPDAGFDASESDSGTPPPDLHVLFVGNSYTYVNDLPGMLAQLSLAPGAYPHIVTSSVTQGGATLDNLWQGTDARVQIAQGGFSHVVLQEQSETPLCVGAQFNYDANLFSGAAREAGATPVLYETWARADASSDYAMYPCLGGEPTGMQDRLLAAYASVATENAGVLVPAGEAWRAVRAKQPVIDLFQADDSHPTPAGTYLTACTFYVKLTGRPVPEGASVPAGVDPSTAALLREAAWEAVAPRAVACGSMTCARGCCESGACTLYASQSRTSCGAANATCTPCAGACSLGRCDVILASGQDSPQGIAHDDANVYWTDLGGSVMKVPLGGGVPTAVASGLTTPTSITVDANSVYWTNRGAVMKVPLGGGGPTALASGQSVPSGLAVDATSVYWANSGSGSVMKVPVGGGMATTLASGPSGPAGIAVDATSVYWTNATTGTVMKVPLDGGVPIALASGQDSPTSIAVDVTSVYFATTTATGLGFVMKVPLGGGNPVALASGEPPNSIAVDATGVYWTNNDLSAAAGAGAVMKLPLEGGVPTMLALAQNAPMGIAVDATSIYWTNLYDGTVMRVSPK
jgi:hypothetical protein